MAIDASLHRALGDPSRVRILEALRAAEGPCDAAQLAAEVGLHPSTVRSHLRVLIGAGLVTAHPEERHRRGRPRLVYEARDEDGDADASSGYRLLAEILASELASSGEDSIDRALQAGRMWGGYLVARRPPHTTSSTDEDIAAVLSLLEQVGFAPTIEPDEVGHTVLMQRCPFCEVADHYRKIVCAVHLGLIQGALSELGGHVEAERLVPFERPGICAAHLGAAPSCQ